jgi:hypothetical protein
MGARLAIPDEMRLHPAVLQGQGFGIDGAIFEKSTAANCMSNLIKADPVN